jgi:hypothetical protein
MRVVFIGFGDFRDSDAFVFSAAFMGVAFMAFIGALFIAFLTPWRFGAFMEAEDFAMAECEERDRQ